MKCDACGDQGDIRLAGELLPPYEKVCRNCLGLWTTNWFYLRRPGDFDDDALHESSLKIHATALALTPQERI